LNFFISSTWNPSPNGSVIQVHGFSTLSGASYGMVVFFVGTILSSGLALLIGVPLSLGIAILLSQVAPRSARSPLSLLVELLAGIPSVVFGFWGILILVPLLTRSVEPVMSRYLGFIPGLGGHVYSSGLMSSGIILALMIVPIIASLSRDAMAQVPIELKEGGRALGMTNWEVTRKIVLPFSKTTIIGAVILGLGRALGETMAVAMVSGAAVNILPGSLYYPINSLAAFMAESLDGAFSDPTKMQVYSLVELALVLVSITVVINIAARVLVKQGFIGSAEHVVQV
jgi:phosphate transport system permease protein